MGTLPLALPAPPARPLPAHLATAVRETSAGGFYPLETHDEEPFRWMGPTAWLEFDSADVGRFLEFSILSEFDDLSQELTVTVAGRATVLPLLAEWTAVTAVVPAGTSRVALAVNKLFPPEYRPGDGRDLGARLRTPILHHDAARHARILARQQNAVTNRRELLTGRATLDSTPPSLGIDLYGACNVKPPCVYCEWDTNKALEGDHVDTPFTTDTLEEWGPFFDNSRKLVNCSIGEPFMMKNLDDLLDAFGDGEKFLEMTTNGQILTDRNIQKLLARPIDLYISLDAGTPETYAKLRNARFDSILVNLRRLIEAKGGPGRHPTVSMVFMPMRVNLHELDRFIEICADLRVDRVVLRPLNYSDRLELNWDRAGHRFEYQRELLPWDELVRTSGRAAELCRRAGLTLTDQMDFGSAMGEQFETLFEQGRRSVAPTRQDPRDAQPDGNAPEPTVVTPAAAPRPSLSPAVVPECTEPWKSLYILRRGVFPCCYGYERVAPMTGYREVWNSPLLQDIRAHLARGEFHSYCLASPACPIVRKKFEAHELARPSKTAIRAREAVNWVHNKWPRTVWVAQWSTLRLKRVFTEPAYWEKQAARVWRAITRAS